ncbi:outer membrane beta-barrel protein [Sphingopyxis sp. BSN-002]|uniref:OmpW/AlkL family protein n=1 Tax=Sphingopyxis sp. BSN-002 TaxID=2911495 RepID=UPI001EDABA30|nr:OmpW family outer membrane protein [Sphingopyxis sp. BSN-002]UKK85533.1 outer membrane beta-barrel protein [Sphingopyxis sp. BSN-002]
MKRSHLPIVAMAAALAIPGQAYAKTGDVQFKIFATYVAPDGKISDVKLDAIGLPANTQAKADDNITPTVAIEYFVADAISIETIAGVTQHDVNGRGGLNGATLVSDAKIVPATLTLKYHFGKDGGIQPYVGAGPSYFIFIDEKPGATTRALGATRQKMGDKLGVALQAGIDIPVNDKGLAFSLDAKRYFLRPTATWFAGATPVLKTRHTLDPWVLSAGVAFRF